MADAHQCDYGRWRVSFYEPNVDPGGYMVDVDVMAGDQESAHSAAWPIAEERFPDNRGLVVWRTVYGSDSG